MNNSEDNPYNFNDFSVEPRFEIITLKQFRETWEKFVGFTYFENSKYELIRNFELWLEQPLYLVFYNVDRDKLVFKKCSKRGNSAFTKRCYARLMPIKQAISLLPKSFFVHKHGRRIKSKSIFVSLTVDPSVYLGNIECFWRYISRKVDNFIRAMIKRYGDAFVLRGTIESTLKGYPHVHLLFIFKDYEFNCFYYNKKFRVKETKEFHRIGKRKFSPIEDLWELGFIDVEAIFNQEQASSYVVKYSVKPYNPKKCKNEEELLKLKLTLALNWFFRKHSFTFRNKKLLYDLISYKQNSHRGPLVYAPRISPEIVEFLGLVVICKYGDDGKPPPMRFEVPSWHVLAQEVLDVLGVTL